MLCFICSTTCESPILPSPCSIVLSDSTGVCAAEHTRETTLSFSRCVPRTGQYFSLWPWPRSRRGHQIRDVSPPLFQLHGPCISMFRSSIQLEVVCARPEVGTRLHFPPGGYSTNSLYSQWLEVLCLSYPSPRMALALTRNSWGHSHVTALAWPSRITPS